MNANPLRAVVERCRTIPEIGDVWQLNASAAKECALPDAENLIVFLRGHGDLALEHSLREALREAYSGPCGVYFFPEGAIFRTPRPLLVRMTFTGGKAIYSR